MFNDETAVKLIDAGADINIKDKEGKGPADLIDGLEDNKELIEKLRTSDNDNN